MHYFKIIRSGSLVGVATSQDFRCFQQKHRILLACAAEKVQYVECGEEYYHDNWMVAVDNDKIKYHNATVIRIDESEYDQLVAAEESGEEIVILPEHEQIIEESVPLDPIEEVTLEYLKTAKITQMDSACRKAIIGGCDLTLSDGKQSHFSFEITDQMQIGKLRERAMSGDTFLPYHADGEPCKNFAADDILALYGAMEETIQHHTTYFNSLKIYIGSMIDKQTVADVWYGMDIPEEYQTEVLKLLLNKKIINY